MGCKWPSGTGGPGEYRQTLLQGPLCDAAPRYFFQVAASSKWRARLDAVSGPRHGGRRAAEARVLLSGHGPGSCGSKGLPVKALDVVKPA